MTDKTVTFSIDNQAVDCPTHKATLGWDVIDIKPVTTTQHFTYDPGFGATAACESKITFIDGQQGILLHHGYPIDQLAFDTDYMEVCHLLIHGELPSSSQKDTFINNIKNHNTLDNQIPHLFKGFHRDAHPMSMLISASGALAALYHNALDINDPAQRELCAYRLIAKLPILGAMCHKHNNNEDFVEPNNELSYSENFLNMILGTPNSHEKPNPVLSQALDRIFTLHADHEQNASTSTVRAVGSTGANPFACITAGIAALWGPAHGGANEACLKMLQQIGNENNINDYITKAKDKNDPFRLMGFGHRVYKNYDPRAKVMQQTCHEVLDARGLHDDPLFKLAMKLEKIALEDPYFIEKKLYPNVDFYSGITLNALGIPSSLFTVIFAIARTVGWISHWMEMMNDTHQRIARPRQLYTGRTQRDVVPLDKR